MQMTKSRKVIAMLLAVLMAFSSMSVFASAINTNSDGDIIYESTDGLTTTDGSNLHATIDVKFFDADGNEIENLGIVTPGQSVQARVYVGTNYYTSTSDLLFYFDRDFLDLNYTEVTVGDETIKNATINANSAAMTSASGTTVTATAEVSSYEETGDEGTVYVSLIADAGAPTFVLDSSVYLFALDFTVKSDASSDDDGIGAVYAKASDLATQTAMDNMVNIPYGASDDDDSQVASSYMFNSTLAVTNNQIQINNKVTFYNDTTDTVGTEVTGKVNSEYTVPTASKEGYTFKGWASASGLTIAADATTFVMPAEANAEYYAVWDQNVVVTVDPNGGTFADGTTAAKTEEAEQGTEWASQPAVPTRDGYKFMGWSVDGTVIDALPSTYPTVTGDKTAYTYTAQWEKLVKITIDPNGGTFADNTTAAKEYQDTDPATAVIVGGQAWNTTSVPTYDIAADTYAATGISNTGYALMGWSTSDGTILQSFPTTFPEDDETYTAVWQAMDVRVYYFADATAAAAADVDTSTTYTNSARVNYVSVPYGTNYEVLGYTTDGKTVATWTTPDGATYAPGTHIDLTAPTVTFSASGIPNKIVLIASDAQFTDASEHTATFMPNGGSWADGTTAAKTVTIQYNAGLEAATAELGETPVKTGYAFNEWVLDGEEGNTYVADWTAKEYAITYNFTEAGGSEVSNIEYGRDFEEPEAMRDGYELEGWYLDADCTTPVTGWADIAANANASNEITVYAKWVANDVVITFNPANGEDKYDITRKYDAKILGDDIADPTKDNYEFVYWVDADGNEVTADDTVKAAAEYTAVYEPGLQKINYYIDGNIYASVNVPYGTTSKILTYTTSDITVDSWSTADKSVTLTAGQDYTPASRETLDLYANVTAKTYTATFNLGADDAAWANEDDATPKSYKSGEMIIAPADPTREGYVFKGWTPAVGTMGEEDQEFTAQWILGDAHIITYKNGDVTVEAFSVDYGDDIEVTENEPEKAGYKFTGWLDENDKAPEDYASMPNADLTFTAQFEALDQPITYMVDGEEITLTPDSAKTDESFRLADVPVKPGYSYSAWTLEDGSAVPETMPAGGITVVSTSTALDQPITYYVDGVENTTLTPNTAKTGETIKLADALAGYSAWTLEDGSAVPTVMPYGGVKVYSVRTTVDYTFDANGGAWADGSTTMTETVDAAEAPEDEQSAATALVTENPTREGYTFEGWKADETDSTIMKAQWKAIVKLVPVDADSTAMIERDGVVETYNTFAEGAKTPYGVTSIIAPNAEAYTASGFDSWYVYGLSTGLSVSDLANYVKATGDGTYKVYKADGTEAADSDILGTGIVIKVYDGETVVEEFHVVIFGDLDGDGEILALDMGRLNRIVRSGESVANYLKKASDIDLDGELLALDTGKLNSASRGKININQKTGYAG